MKKCWGPAIVVGCFQFFADEIVAFTLISLALLVIQILLHGMAMEGV